MITHVDGVRESRGVLGVIFSKRRLGEGQAFRCALAQGKASAYLRHERVKFALYALDWLCVLLLFFGFPGLLACCLIQSMQIGYLLSRGRVRAFASQKLFFFAFPLGLCTYRVRNRAYAAV